MQGQSFIVGLTRILFLVYDREKMSFRSSMSSRKDGESLILAFRRIIGGSRLYRIGN